MSRKQNGFLAEFKKNKALFAMAAPAFVLVLVMSYLPMSGLVLAFKSYRLDRAAAVGVVFFLILLICTLVTMKWSDRKVNYDA